MFHPYPINRRTLLCACAAAPIAIDWTSETELSTAFRFDSKPFSLNRNFASAFFSEIEGDHEYSFEIRQEAELELSIDGRARLYESDADTWSIKPSIELSSPTHDWSGGRIDGDIELLATYRDSTFTSSRTEEEATSGGVLVGDRYDSWTYNSALASAIVSIANSTSIGTILTRQIIKRHATCYIK